MGHHRRAAGGVAPQVEEQFLARQFLRNSISRALTRGKFLGRDGERAELQGDGDGCV